jgi:hypothetical protein
MKKRKEGKMSDDLVERLQAGSIWGRSVHDTLIEWMKERKRAADRIEELEAKLAKAQGALHQIAGKKDYADDPWGIARTTLAELKGQDDE